MTALAAAFARLPGPAQDWDARLTLGAAPAGAVTLADLARGGAALAALVDAKRDSVRGGDDRQGCAYLIGDLGWHLGQVLGGLWLAGWPVGALAPAAVALSPRLCPWEEDGDRGVAHVIDLAIDPGGLAAGPAEAGQLARVMVDLHQGLIAELARTTGLGVAAQWRLVGDGLSGALLQQGKAMHAVERAVALGRAILADRGSRLGSRQTEYVRVTLPGPIPAAGPDGGASDWFRLRGGCCRHYTTSGGDYCTTCVLRDRDEQIDRLTAYLRRRTGAA